jgi:hypothetical protein
MLAATCDPGKDANVTVCARCMKPKPPARFRLRSDRADRRDSYCLDCRRAVSREWARAHAGERRESARMSFRAARSRLRSQLVEAYGGCCACCGEKEQAFLVLDHDGDVPRHHRDGRGRRIGGTALYRIVKKEGYPSSYRLLCWNCNAAHAYYGSCPHQDPVVREKRDHA